MSFADKKGISVASGFKLQAEALLDARGQVDTLQERDELVTIHAVTDGLIVFVKETKAAYQWNGTEWQELAVGSGYTHPTTPGYKHIPAGGSNGKVLGWKADGEAQWVDDKDTTYNKATTSADGLMAKEDKEKLDGIDEGANNYQHPANHPASMITEDATHRFVTDTEKQTWANKYTKEEVDNKFSTLETSIDWKEAVGTFDDIATTYPEPEEGWTVSVNDTDTVYRYNGTAWVGISANTIPKATSSVDGKMSKEDKAKLDGIAEGANKYVHPNTAGNKHIPSGGSAGKVLVW